MRWLRVSYARVALLEPCRNFAARKHATGRRQREAPFAP